jgi:hypothetical protein
MDSIWDKEGAIEFTATVRFVDRPCQLLMMLLSRVFTSPQVLGSISEGSM